MTSVLAKHAAHFRKQAEWCERLGSPFNAALLRGLADNLGNGSVLDGLLAAGETPLQPSAADAGPLRVAGALHALVLSGRDEALAGQYPAQRPDWDMDAVLPAAYRALEGHRGWVSRFLINTPQTNETRRSIALLPGFAALEGPLHLLEIGASAGLNQHWDAFGYDGGHWSRPGAAGAPVIASEWQGAAPELPDDFNVASRRACDVSPLDVGNPEARLSLQAYIWPDQADRLARVRAAIDLACERGVSVEKAGGADWLESELAQPLALGTTVIFHSIAWQYFDETTHRRASAAIQAAAARADDEHRLAWLRFEHGRVFDPLGDSQRYLVDLVTWPGGARREIAEADPHGRMVRVLGQAP